MRSSILIVFLIVVIKSSTYGDDGEVEIDFEVDNIFGVPIDPGELRMLSAGKVEEVINDLNSCLDQFADVVKKNSQENESWTRHFRRIIQLKKEIIEILDNELTHLNTKTLKMVKKKDCIDRIGSTPHEKLQKKLQAYVEGVRTLQYNFIFTEHTFLKNSFEEFFGKVGEIVNDEFKRKMLKKYLKKAEEIISKAKTEISSINLRLMRRLKEQKELSSGLMASVRNLDLNAALGDKEKIGKSIKELDDKFQTLQKKISEYNEANKKAFGREVVTFVEDFTEHFAEIDFCQVKLIELLKELPDLIPPKRRWF